MREGPILFSAPMIRAILEGRKTQTRRVAVLPAETGFAPISDPDAAGRVFALCFEGPDEFSRALARVRSPHGAPGDRLWVRETHAQFSVGNRAGLAPQCVAYRATCDADGGFDYVNNGDEIMRIRVTKWTPAIYMPRWASRITLEVAAVRVERLQDISEEDARVEGITGPFEVGYQAWCVPGDGKPRYSCARAAFEALWDSINGKRAPWASNPWVWVVSFKRAEATDGR